MEIAGRPGAIVDFLFLILVQGLILVRTSFGSLDALVDRRSVLVNNSSVVMG